MREMAGIRQEIGEGRAQVAERFGSKFVRGLGRPAAAGRRRMPRVPAAGAAPTAQRLGPW